MVNPIVVKRQLKAIGADSGLLCRAERRELHKILFESEQIAKLVVGSYSGGMAILCATDHRILLVDKKPFYLTLEDIRYDMISDVMFNNRLLNSSLVLGTIHKSIEFKSYNQAKIRTFTSYVQRMVMETRSGQSTLGRGMAEEQTNSPQPQVGAFGVPVKPNKNPYNNMPVIMRNRVSKYY